MSGARPDTWMPWYIGDYLRKTMHLDADEDGSYRRLIDATWVRGGVLKASDKELALISKLPLKKWLAIKATVAEFFEITEEGWRHGRVSEELAKAEALVSARSAGGKRTAEKRWGNAQNGSSTIAEEVAELPLSESQSGRPSPSPSPSQEEVPSKATPSRERKRRSHFPPDWQPDQQDIDFARERGRDDGWIAEQSQRCRDHHIGRGTLTANVPATWRTWVMKAADFERGNRNGHGSSQGRVNGFVEVQREALRRAEEHDRGPTFALRE